MRLSVGSLTEKYMLLTNILQIACVVVKKGAFCIRHERLAIILSSFIQVYNHTVQVAVLVAEWKSTTSASCNWWQPPLMQVKCLHQLKEGKHHKRKVQRWGCKMQRSGPASSLISTGCSTTCNYNHYHWPDRTSTAQCSNQYNLQED